MKKTFGLEKQAVWTEYEMAKGVHIPQGFRQLVEELAELVYCFKDLELYKCSVLQVTDLIFNASIYIYMYIDRKNKEQIKDDDTIRRRRNQKCFERCLYLVDFVKDQAFPDVLGVGLDSNFPMAFNKLIRRRIPWKQICNEWNKKHPSDSMTPAVLKAEYHRAKKEKDIASEYFIRRCRRYIQESEEVSLILGMINTKIMHEALGSLALQFSEDVTYTMIHFCHKLSALFQSDRQEIINFLRELYQEEIHNERSYMKEGQE